MTGRFAALFDARLLDAYLHGPKPSIPLQKSGPFTTQNFLAGPVRKI